MTKITIYDNIVTVVGNRFKSESAQRFLAQLAQLVEQRTENPRVSGSIPELGIPQEVFLYQMLYISSATHWEGDITYAGVVQW